MRLTFSNFKHILLLIELKRTSSFLFLDNSKKIQPKELISSYELILQNFKPFKMLNLLVERLLLSFIFPGCVCK